MKRRGLSLLCALAMTLGLLVVPVSAAETTLSAKGWLETICAQLTGVSDADVTGVRYTGQDGVSVALTGDDFDFLVRDMEGGVRIDIPGVKAGTYSLEVETAGQTYAAHDIQVTAHDRSGYAHWNYTEGVGAYNDDGTLKANAKVLYVTDDNKNTVSLSVRQGGGALTVTGIGNILNRGPGNEVNNGILQQLTLNEHTPLVVRIIGAVTAPEGLTPWVDSTDIPRDNGANGSMAVIRSAINVTVEGIGPDACMDGWGVSFGLGQGGAAKGLGRNFEVRNLTFRNVPEDCVEVAGRLPDDWNDIVEHAWVHNCAFYVPYIENAAADDKHQGDSAVDFKAGQYMTLSYNYIEGYNKTSLVGAGAEGEEQYHVTWHHNHWKGCNQRCPLVRTANMHIYNNLYEDTQNSGATHCMCLRANSYIFSEYNHFLNCANPVRVDPNAETLAPGVCKSWQDVFERCRGVNQAVRVAARDEAVSNHCKYSDFDTNPELSYIPTGDYALDESIAEARANIDAYAGPMKALEEIVIPGHSHQWSGWQVVEAIGCTHDGLWTRTCSAADCPVGSESRTVPACGHRYEGYYCVRCGDDLGGKTYTLTADQTVQDETDRPTLGMTMGGDPEKPTSYHISDAINGVGGTEDFFTIMYGANARLDPSAITFEDGYRSSWRFNMNSSASTRADAVQMNIPVPATVRIWWVGAAEGRSVVLLNEKGAEVAVTQAAAGDYAPVISQLSVTDPGAYYLGSKGGRNYIYKVEVTMAPDPDTVKSGTLAGPDGRELRWKYTDQGQLALADAPGQDERVVVGCYDGGGRFLGAKVLTDTRRSIPLETDIPVVRLFWLDDRERPLSQAVTVWGGE